MVAKYLEQIETLKKPNTHRKYEAVLQRFLDFFRDRESIDGISGEDLTDFIISLKRDHKLGANTILHNAVIVAQFFKRNGRGGMTRDLPLPERITPLPREYREDDLARFLAAGSPCERALFATFLMTGFREQEVMYLFWSDVNLDLQTVRVTAKPHLDFFPKRWEEREVPVPVKLVELLRAHPRDLRSPFVFPSPTGHREQNMLLRCKVVAARAGLDPAGWDLKTFRSTYATRNLRAGFDVRTVQHWMGHRSLETTMRYLVPARDVYDRLDQISLPGAPASTVPLRKGPAGQRRTGGNIETGMPQVG